MLNPQRPPLFDAVAMCNILASSPLCVLIQELKHCNFKGGVCGSYKKRIMQHITEVCKRGRQGLFLPFKGKRGIKRMLCLLINKEGNTAFQIAVHIRVYGVDRIVIMVILKPNRGVLFNLFRCGVQCKIVISHGNRSSFFSSILLHTIGKKLPKRDDTMRLQENGKEMENATRETLGSLPVTVLFVDGNHEHHPRLNDCPVDEWMGGKVHVIEPGIIHLMNRLRCYWF